MKTYTSADSVQLVHSGSNYFEVLQQLIREAKEVLYIQTYILTMDETGISIIEELKAAVARKVEVWLLIDAFGSNPFPSETINMIRRAGIHFRLFSPLFSSESMFFGRRLHHKIVVADRKVALVGGINLADKYRIGTGTQPWLDYAVLTKGPVCEYLHLLCEQVHKKRRAEKKLKTWEQQMPGASDADLSPQVSFRRNDWIKRKNEIYKSYASELSKAKTSVTIVASYFLPGNTFRKLLREASKRGVEIKIILAGQSDIGSLRFAETYLYAFYLRHNIKLYEWTNSMMHGKAMVVDNQWTTIGSYNLNYLSHYISIELNADVIDVDFARSFTAHLDKITTNDCTFIKLDHKKEYEHWYNRLRMWLAYTMFRLLQGFFMIGKRHRIKRK